MEVTEDVFEEYPDVVTVNQLLDMLHIKKNFAYKLINSSKIKTFECGRSYRILKSNVIDYIKQQ